MEEFVKRLKELRKEKGLTQLQLANATKISVSAISSWENNTRIPNAIAIITLAKFFEVTTDYLLGVSDIY
ncbi:MAG: helix-turn-helix domain-containing protein [Clostridia bacterium]|nr:helix-turn-helix domain-containing protein [Clostridia bacterium]MDE6606089.1 helix-turn-helix domain-containing protein [Clostridia bacterium]MDE7208977.1 helix-turn-helix domain-containing protein [Clostridia bacterium]